MAEMIADRLASPVPLGRAKAALDRPGDITARIGPNAILQLAQLLRHEDHQRWLRDVFYRAGLSAMLVDPPIGMVDEIAVADLYQALFERLPPAAAKRIAGEAGRRTGRYILAHRIPRPAHILLKLLPADWSVRLLLRAIRRHAWTFAGSGEVLVLEHPLPTIEIARNPIAMPGCVWHVGVFEALFRELTSTDATVTHVSCCREGATACRFEITLPSTPKG